MATKFVGENLSCVKWVPLSNSVLDKASRCITVGRGSRSKTVSLWECSTEKIKLIAKEPLTSNGTGLAFLSHKCFVTGGDDVDNQSLQVWSITGDELESGGSLKTNNKLTTCVASTEKLVSSVGEEGHLQVHIPTQSRPVYSAKCEMCLNTCAFYLSHSVLVGSAAGQVHCFDTRQQGDTPASTMSSELVSILGIAVHTTQPFIVANSRSDGSLLIWDMRNNRYPLATFAGHASAIWEVQFEKEKSDNLYTCSEDGQLLMWNGAALSGVGGLLGGGGKVSPWLTPEISHQKMDVFNLLGSDNKLSINSFDVLQGKVVCGGARQTLFCTDSCDE